MKPCLVDTDILSAFMRGDPKVIRRVENHIKKFGVINLSVITYYEILNGLYFKDAKKQLVAFEQFVALSRVLPVTASVARTGASIRADLRKRGYDIGHTDILIASVAQENELAFATNNTKHFKPIKGLRIENWMK